MKWFINNLNPRASSISHAVYAHVWIAINRLELCYTYNNIGALIVFNRVLGPIILYL